MNTERLLKRLPDSPGVYFFLGARRKILYIGRATSLRDRVRSYFTHDLAEVRSPLIAKMIAEAKGVDFKKTDSVLESILLEADLIKKFKPPYNTDDKDDKSFNCVVITDEEYPQIVLVRKKELEGDRFTFGSPRKVFGPFTEGGKLKLALKIIRKIFPYRDGKCVPNSGKSCFNRQIGLCPGVCMNEVTKMDYEKTVCNIERLFEGKKSSIIRVLRAEMKQCAKLHEFEKAGEIKRQLFSLQHIADVALITETAPSDPIRSVRIEAFDIAHTSGHETVGVMTVVFGASADKKSYRMFLIRGAKAGDDVGALREVLSRRFSHPEWGMPGLVVVDGGKSQLNAAQKLLATIGLSIPLVSVVKDERHRPREVLGDSTYRHTYERGILLANAEAHRFAISFHRRRRDRIGVTIKKRKSR